MTNLRNYGVAEGRLTRDPKVFENKDGSKTVSMTIAADDNFRSGADNARGSQFIPVKAFVASGRDLGAYARLHQGDLVGVLYEVRSSQYEKDGETVYAHDLMVQSVDFKETQATVNARVAARVAAETAPATV